MFQYIEVPHEESTFVDGVMKNASESKLVATFGINNHIEWVQLMSRFNSDVAVVFVCSTRGVTLIQPSNHDNVMECMQIDRSWFSTYLTLDPKKTYYVQSKSVDLIPDNSIPISSLTLRMYSERIDVTTIHSVSANDKACKYTKTTPAEHVKTVGTFDVGSHSAIDLGQTSVCVKYDIVLHFPTSVLVRALSSFPDVLALYIGRTNMDSLVEFKMEHNGVSIKFDIDSSVSDHLVDLGVFSIRQWFKRKNLMDVLDKNANCRACYICIRDDEPLLLSFIHNYDLRPSVISRFFMSPLVPV
jgi:hypothetical protein